MVTLTTFRADEGDITSDPSNPTDGDTTTGLYDEATGLKVKKTYADGSSTIKTYDKFNRLETLTKARGIVTTPMLLSPENLSPSPTVTIRQDGSSPTTTSDK